MTMFSVNNLCFRYEENGNDEQAVVLDDVSFTVKKGSFVALLGHNGCGKSTLAKHLNAMLLPLGGSVLVKDMDTVDEKNVYAIRSTVGMVLQNPDNQLVSTIVEEDVAFGPENLGVPPSEIRERVDAALQAVNMYDYRLHASHKLSGGQKQRVAIAGVLAMNPECIVLDEPTAMLDPVGRREVMETICRLHREQGMTVVLITHYMEEAVLADRVVVMEQGKMVMDGTPREIFSQAEKLKNMQLDVPQPTELAHLLSKDGICVPTDILTVEECVEMLTMLLKK